MAKPVEFTSESFEQDVLQSDVPVLVDFWAEWCGPCKMIAPTIEELASEYEGKVKIGKLNVDEHPQVAQSFNVRSIPTLLLFKGGQVVDQIIGAVPKGEITRRLDQLVTA